MIEFVLSGVFWVLTIMYGFTCFGRLFRGERIYSTQVFLMAIGITGLILMR